MRIDVIHPIQDHAIPNIRKNDAWLQNLASSNERNDLLVDLDEAIAEANAYQCLWRLVQEADQDNTTGDDLFVETEELSETLSVINTAVCMLQAIETNPAMASQRVHFARAFCQRYGAAVLLRGAVDTDPATGQSYELWIRLVADEFNEFPETPCIFRLSASLVRRAAGDHAELIGTLQGAFIPTLNDEGFIHSEDLLDAMDGHSQWLADVYKTIHGEFLPSIGKKAIGALSNERDSLLPGVGLCVPWLFEIAKPYRGKQLAGIMLDAIQRVCAEPHAFLLKLDHHETTAGVDDHDEPVHSQTEVLDLIFCNPIRLVVIGVQGTANKEPRDIALRDSLLKFQKPRVLEMAVEARRDKLTRYFRSLDAVPKGYRIHVYNPYDYPFT